MKVTTRQVSTPMEVVGTTTIKGYTYFVLVNEAGKFSRVSIDECTMVIPTKKKKAVK